MRVSNIPRFVVNYIRNLQRADRNLRQREYERGTPTPDIQSTERGLTSLLSTVVLVRTAL